MRQEKNKGSASLEASLVLPVFLLAMVLLFLVFQSVLVEAQLYEAAAEMAEYMSEIAYMEHGNAAIAYLRFPKYIDDTELIDRYVSRGAHGVGFLGSTMDAGDQHILLCVNYDMKYMGSRAFTIKKRAYTGEDWKDADAQEVDTVDAYVYVTDNQSVYHLTRRCTYLSLQIQTSSRQAAEKQGYDACAFCGETAPADVVYITEEGRKYHSRLTCSGLKRTVYRKKKSEVQGLAPCSRCGGTE